MSYRKLWLGLALGVAMSSIPAWAQDQAQQTTDQKIQQLQQKVDELEKKSRPIHLMTTARTRPTATADYPTASRSGPRTATSCCTSAPICKSTIAPTTARDPAVVHRHDCAAPRSSDVFRNGLQVRRFLHPARFRAGDHGHLRRLHPAQLFPWFQVRAGKFKPPVGLERLQSDDDTNFVERGLPTLLVPQRDIGYQIGGRSPPSARVVIRSACSTACPTARSAPTRRVSNHRDYAARLFLTPFQPNEQQPARGAGLRIWRRRAETRMGKPCRPTRPSARIASSHSPRA